MSRPDELGDSMDEHIRAAFALLRARQLVRLDAYELGKAAIEAADSVSSRPNYRRSIDAAVSALSRYRRGLPATSASALEAPDSIVAKALDRLGRPHKAGADRTASPSGDAAPPTPPIAPGDGQ